MDWGAYFSIVLWSIFGGLFILAVVGGYYHLRYYVLRRGAPETWKCQPKRFLRPDQQRQALRLSCMNLVIGGILSGSFIYGLQHGLQTPLYFEVEEYGWTYTLLSTLVLFVMVDGLAYYAHRLLHVRALFPHIHRWHHRYIATTPFVVTAMHPVEFVTFQAATFLPMFVLPFWAGSAVFVFVYILVFNIIDHSGVKLKSSLPWQGPSTFHDDHHVYFHCNFGQVLTLWDRVHDTLRREGRRYGADVYGGKGKPIDGAARGKFIRY
jgi:Delta7-sterol 5-desaturase